MRGSSKQKNIVCIKFTSPLGLRGISVVRTAIYMYFCYLAGKEGNLKIMLLRVCMKSLSHITLWVDPHPTFESHSAHI